MSNERPTPTQAQLADRRSKRALADARCAWKAMTEVQRTEFRAFIDKPYDSYHVVLVTQNGTMTVHLDDISSVSSTDRHDPGGPDGSWCWVELSCGSILAVLGKPADTAKRCGLPFK